MNEAAAIATGLLWGTIYFVAGLFCRWRWRAAVAAGGEDAGAGWRIAWRILLVSAVLGALSGDVLLRSPLWQRILAPLGVAVIYGLWRYWTDRDPRQIAARDVVNDAEAMRKLAAAFDPARYINLDKGIFVGLDGRRAPIYLPKQTIDKNHIEVLGESGVGKSSIAGVLLSQLAASGECVIVFDPKNDRNLPGALARAGAEWGGYPVHVVDLRPQIDYPQLNPFAGARPDQVEELLQVALELGKTGDAGVDYYRGKDREATGFIAEAFADDGKTDMLEIIDKARADERVTEQENLWRELRQLGKVRALHTSGGLDLRDVLSRPGVLYVIGSTTRLEVVAAQKLILQRCLQIIDERRDQSMPVAMFLDELKYILSPAALRAAGTIRDRNCHLLFAHQSLGDLDDCPGLSPKAVRGAIWGNSGIKIVYKMLDAGTAAELSRIAGTVASADETVSVRDGQESVTLTHKQTDYMPAHVFTHLPKPTNGEASVGLVFGLGPAWYLSTRYLESGPAPEPLRAEPAVAAPVAALPVAVAPAAAVAAAPVAALPVADADAPAPAPAPAIAEPAPPVAPVADSLDDLLK